MTLVKITKFSKIENLNTTITVLHRITKTYFLGFILIYIKDEYIEQ